MCIRDSITTEYAKSEATQTADNDDVIHLLWSSDRLEIVREVDSRITKIYADLVSLEKMMHYKMCIRDRRGNVCCLFHSLRL